MFRDDVSDKDHNRLEDENANPDLFYSEQATISYLANKDALQVFC